MSFQIKVGLNVWFYSISPTHGYMTAKCMPKSQTLNIQTFRQIWRFEIIIVSL